MVSLSLYGSLSASCIIWLHLRMLDYYPQFLDIARYYYSLSLNLFMVIQGKASRGLVYVLSFGIFLPK